MRNGHPHCKSTVSSGGLVFAQMTDHLLHPPQENRHVILDALLQDVQIERKVGVGDEISHTGDFGPRDI